MDEVSLVELILLFVNMLVFKFKFFFKFGGSVAEWSACRTRNPAVLGLSPALTITWICFWVAPS